MQDNHEQHLHAKRLTVGRLSDQHWSLHVKPLEHVAHRSGCSTQRLGLLLCPWKALSSLQGGTQSRQASRSLHSPPERPAFAGSIMILCRNCTLERASSRNIQASAQDTMQAEIFRRPGLRDRQTAIGCPGMCKNFLIRQGSHLGTQLLAQSIHFLHSHRRRLPSALH